MSYYYRPRKEINYIQDNYLKESTDSANTNDDEEYDSDSDPEYLPPWLIKFNLDDLGKQYRINSKQTTTSIAANASIQSYTNDEKTYLNRLDTTDKNALINLDKTIRSIHNTSSVPLRFKILKSTLDDRIKYILLTKLEQFQQMNEDHGEYFKLKHWIHSIRLIPFNQYVSLPITFNSSLSDIQQFMRQTRDILDQTVYGHNNTKQQFLRIIAQWISNPSSHGHCIGIQGAPGTGKTSFVKDGISKALGLPFGFITLGGASDGAFLEGHSITYEGSTYGKIVEILMKTQCMNPIIFFDELDKVSITKKGEEIIGILTHLTDHSQNKCFTDKYFSEIELDISRALIIFSYNDESKLNPILKDRLITLHVDGYTDEDKINIARHSLIPKILQAYGFEKEKEVVRFSDKIIIEMIKLIPKEQGIRNLKRAIECIISWINMSQYMNKDFTFPIDVSFEMLQNYLKNNLNI
jgi:ATP-dependent Lon protease